MKFHISTDYAIRIVVYLAQHAPQVVTAEEISMKLGITYAYYNKVASILKQAGLIETIKGPGGGYMFIKDPADVSMYDIIGIMQGPIRINRCLEDDGFCSRFGVQHGQCSVHGVFASLQSDIIEYLKQQTIAKISQAGNS